MGAFVLLAALALAASARGADDVARNRSSAPLRRVHDPAHVLAGRHLPEPGPAQLCFKFGEVQAVERKVAQGVHIIDGNGDAWETLYTLETEPDSSVKANDCVLLKPRWQR